ncbi:glycosyltransferase, partial [candidate division KSB3 bacterium]|nr:glycosyltransferase [candidate division KSB3 bacterium]MBD3327365.1 glycosyltransferase [candidate division KSB3 bacterium]
NAPTDAASQEHLGQIVPDAPYMLYVGRVDVMKGCRNLITAFLRYLDTHDTDLHLVLLGKQTMSMPDHPRIQAPGAVNNAQKEEAIRGATLVVNPSEYESLSLLMLEAWQFGIPVLVNGRSEVLVEHCLQSNGGLYYTNDDEFALALDLLLANPALRDALGRQGKCYVAERYAWDTVEKIYVDFITQIGNGV